MFKAATLQPEVSNTLDAESSLAVVKEAIARHGKPEILNSDQGSQFTCALYLAYLKDQKIQISMDGKRRALDNIYIERFGRTIKPAHLSQSSQRWSATLSGN